MNLVETIFKLAGIAVIPVIVCVILYLVRKQTAFNKMKYIYQQVIIGVIFGGLAIIGTEFGVDIGGAKANSRAAAVLIASLVFGKEAGIIAGVIGAVERYFTPSGDYTRIACTFSTLFAGLFGAWLRKYLFDDKKPSVVYALAIGIITEVLHMVMVFVTNMDDITRAFFIVEKCSIPMITVNALASMFGMLFARLIDHDRIFRGKSKVELSVIFHRKLILNVLVAFIITCTFSTLLQVQISKENTRQLLELNITDVENSINLSSDKNILSICDSVKQDLIERNVISLLSSDNKTIIYNALNSIKGKYHVTDIFVINNDGIITGCTTTTVKNPNGTTEEVTFIGENMYELGEQSREFMILVEENGPYSYVQKYQPMAANPSISRKFAGVRIEGYGFVQVSYDASTFQAQIDDEIYNATKNRHVGNNGFIIITDQNGKIISNGGEIDNDGSFNHTEFSSLKSAKTRNVYSTLVGDDKSYIMYDEAEGYYIISVISYTEANFNRNISIYITIFMECLVFVLLFIVLSFVIKQNVVKSIDKVNNGLSKITSGDLNQVIDVHTSIEFTSLSDDINQTVNALKDAIEEAKRRIDNELEFAKTIQHSALPTNFNSYENRHEFDIYASMHTAKEVGGDFYDFYMLGNKLVVMVADVSGKGIPAAMFMMRSKSLIKSYAESGCDVDEIFTQANDKLSENNSANMFVTSFLALIDLESGKVEFANAGHNAPLIKRNGRFEYLHSKPGFVLAGMEGVKYKKQEFYLSPGDQLFLYTDGVTEANDINESLYGEERLLNLLNNASYSSQKELLNIVIDDVFKFQGEASQFDDITMLGVTFNGGKTKMKKQLTIDAVVDNIETVTDFVTGALERYDCPMKAIMQISIAIDELFGNIANYAYRPEVGKATVEVEILENPLQVIVTFKDNGKPFDPLKVEDPDITSSAEERQVGGLGIYLVKKSMDAITYEYRSGQNILTIKKQF